MKADMQKEERNVPNAGDSRLFVGRFVRHQGKYGIVAVVGNLRASGVDIIPNPKRLFPRDGSVEIQGYDHHSGLNTGDWVAFDVIKNTRFRAPEYKALNLKRLPRFKPLPESNLPVFRTVLTGEGWRDDARPGLWAFRLAGDMVIVVELVAGKDGRLRVSRTSAREVKCYRYADHSVARLSSGKSSDDVFIAPTDGEMASLDWSDEVDYIARVVGALAGMKDSRFSDIIGWLDRHGELVTGGVSAASGGKEPALDALRSGALANRLRADQELMKVYLAAAMQDEAVHDAITAYMKEGHGAERDSLRAELQEEVAAEKTSQLAKLSAEIEVIRAAGITRVEQELKQYEADGRLAQAKRLQDVEREVAGRIEEFEVNALERRDEFDRQFAEQVQNLEDAKKEVAAAKVELEGLQVEIEDTRGRLTDAKQEIDRLLAISGRLAPTNQMISGPLPGLRSGGVGRAFPDHPMVGTAVKGELITRQVMLSDKGRELLQSLVVMFLAGELPILAGEDTTDLLRIAESIVCPGRYVSIEADPTLISIDDLWARPGSGAPTLLASAADAVRSGGAVLVVIRGVERSGARFWLPALSEALRGGGLPRGLFVCCTVNELEHEEVRALPIGTPWLQVVDILKPGATSGGPYLLTPPRIDLETLDPGPMSADLSVANSVVLEFGGQLSLEMALRVARMFAEATVLCGDEDLAKSLVFNVMKPTILKSY